MREAVKKIGAVLLRPFQFGLYWLSGLVPRDKSLWIFGSWSGERMGDSPRALIDHVVRFDSEISAVWITSRAGIRDELRARGFDARLRWSPGGMWATLRGGVFLYDGLTRDVNHWLSRGAKKVLLRHGIGIKDIERGITTPSHRLYQLFHGNALQRMFWTVLLPWHVVRPSIAIASSPDDVAKAERFFGIPASRVVLTGLPRHDALLRDDLDHLWSDAERAAIHRLESETRPVFLYLPTFRDLRSGFRPSWHHLDEAARKAGVALFVKLHLVDVQRALAGKEAIESYANLGWIDGDVDPMALYRHAVGLVTDFSSVAFDVFLTRKPVLYLVPDLDDYLKGRSLFLPFDEVSPGPKITGYDALAAALDAAKDGDLGAWTDTYDQVLTRFHTHRDGNNTDRVHQSVRALLKGTLEPTTIASPRSLTSGGIDGGQGDTGSGSAGRID